MTLPDSMDGMQSNPGIYRNAARRYRPAIFWRKTETERPQVQDIECRDIPRKFRILGAVELERVEVSEPVGCGNIWHTPVQRYGLMDGDADMFRKFVFSIQEQRERKLSGHAVGCWCHHPLNAGDGPFLSVPRRFITHVEL